MTLTRDQADLLLRYGGSWLLGDIIINPERGISEAKQSMSGAITDEWRWDTDGKGIHARRYIGAGRRWERQERPVELTWTEIRRAVRAIPPKLLDAVGVARRENARQVQRRVPPYLPGGYAPFVYPDPAWERTAKDRLRAACAAAIDAVVPVAQPSLFDEEAS